MGIFCELGNVLEAELYEALSAFYRPYRHTPARKEQSLCSLIGQTGPTHSCGPREEVCDWLAHQDHRLQLGRTVGKKVGGSATGRIRREFCYQNRGGYT